VLQPRAGGGSVFTVDVSAESLSKTTLGRLARGHPHQPGARLEGRRRAWAVTSFPGHVDGVAHDRVSARRRRQPPFRIPGCRIELARFIAPKGSVCLDGTSLTVNEVDGVTFGVNLIPHTLDVTTWGQAVEGDRVNLEIDMLARYVARLNESLKS
jgi:riboflavin synthase